MSKSNKKVINQNKIDVELPHTHGGADSQEISAYKELRRSLMTCMLWENNFYENGNDVAQRIAQLVPQAVRRGLAAAFQKFNEYSLAKWDGNNAIKLRDVMFLVHPKPRDRKESKLFERIANRTLSGRLFW